MSNEPTATPLDFLVRLKFGDNEAFEGQLVSAGVTKADASKIALILSEFDFDAAADTAECMGWRTGDVVSVLRRDAVAILFECAMDVSGTNFIHSCGRLQVTRLDGEWNLALVAESQCSIYEI
jgi:hypothetical protein